MRSAMSKRLWLPLLLLGAGAAAAQLPPSPPPPGPPPARTVGEQLFIAPSGEPFRTAQGAAYPVASWFAAADRNNDAKLTQREFSDDFASFFARLDLDRDGTLRHDEIQRYEREVAPEVASYAPAGQSFRAYANGGDGSSDVGKSSEIESDLRAQAPTDGGRFGLINIPEPVASMGIDFNGAVSLNEMLGAARRRFALLDRASTASLTLADLPQTWAQQHPPKRRR